MRAKSPIGTAPSATTDGRITELHLWAVREGLARRPALWKRINHALVMADRERPLGRDHRQPERQDH